MHQAVKEKINFGEGFVKLSVVFLSDWLANPYKRLLASHLNKEGIEVEEFFRSNIFLPKTIRFIGFGQPGILHLHTLHPLLVGRNSLKQVLKICLFILQILILKISGTRTVWTVHEWSNKLASRKLNISPRTTRLLGYFIDAMITHCPSTCEEVRQAFRVKDKVFVIPHGNYIETYENNLDPQQARQTLNIPADCFTFLLFGSIYPYKGYLEAIDIFKQLKAENAILIIAGKPQEDGLQEEILAKIGNSKNILFVPKRIPDEEVQLYMNAADCVLVPYKVFTTSGMAILAMSFGRVCIAPNVGFFKDMLDEKGSFLYDSAQSDGLQQAMQKAIDHSDQIAAMGQHNYALAQQWNWDFVAKETIKVYQSCFKF
jgi:beta-1,4-mannosyltransferase